MRLNYVPNPPNMETPQDQAILSRVQQRRGGTLLPLDLTLLHSPLVADGWNSFLGAIRTGTSLSVEVRETIICRVAALNEAWFEWEHHAPLLKESGKVKEEFVRVLLQAPANKAGERWEEGMCEPRLRPVVEYTDAMTKDVKVPDEVFSSLKQYYDEREIVEITATAAAYNCVSRFLVALNVDEKNDAKPVA